MTREEAIRRLEEILAFEKAELKQFELSHHPMLVEPTNMDMEAYDMAISGLRQQHRFGEVNKALTLDELSERNAPVFLPIKDFPNGGYWCLCENGYIIPPSGHGFMAKERPNWVFYSQKPEEGTV